MGSEAEEAASWWGDGCGAAELQWVEVEVGSSKSDGQRGASLVVELGRGALVRVGGEEEAKLAAALLGYLGVGQC